MIVNQPPSASDQKIRTELDQNPVARAVCAVLVAASEPFEVTTEGAGIEIRACSFLPSGLPNRARMKIFSPKPDHTLVFFFKKSLVPYSRDRYSYGGIDLRTTEVGRTEVSEWLAFINSGLHPNRRPTNLRRAFPYEVPE